MNHNTKAKASTHCAHCGRPLSSGLGRAHPVLGVLGPECYAKFSGLEAVLLEHGLEALAQGPLTLPMRQVSEEGWGYPPEVLEFKARAERVGLRLEVQLEPTEHGPVVHLALRASAAGRPRLLKELDRHRQFEQRLRREQLAQEMAQEMMDGLGLAGVCTPDGEQIRTSREYDPFDPVGRAKAALEALLMVEAHRLSDIAQEEVTP